MLQGLLLSVKGLEGVLLAHVFTLTIIIQIKSLPPFAVPNKIDGSLYTVPSSMKV